MKIIANYFRNLSNFNLNRIWRLPNAYGNSEAKLVNNDLGSGVTGDDSYACYWEHAVAVTDTGCEILDLRAGEKAHWANALPNVFKN